MLQRKRKESPNRESDSSNQPVNLMDDNTMLVQNWRQALRTPHMYRVGSSTMHIQNKFLVGVIVFLLCIIVFIYISPWITNDFSRPLIAESCGGQQFCYVYNKTYPLSNPQKTASQITYRVAIISDLDHDSKSSDKENTWISFVKRGSLTWLPKINRLIVKWDDKTSTISSSLALKGRSMELSELVVFDGKLLSFDDRTGMVYRVEEEIAYPWIILNDGNGKNTQGFKSEWATQKDEYLYVGSMGKEWTTADGEFVNNNPMWVKKISPTGVIKSIDWSERYKEVRRACNIDFPGYMIHESVMWSSVHKQWFFLPRRCSQDKYNEDLDEMRSCNFLILADENFTSIKVKEIGNLIKVRGFSSFKFLPGSNDSIIVALKTEEYQKQTSTYITVFDIDGNIMLPDVKITDKKFEGIEFV